MLRYLFEIERFKATCGHAAAVMVLVNLPVATAHHVLTSKNRLTVHHPDTPVKVGRHKGLRQNQRAFLKQGTGFFLQLLLIAHFHHTARKGTIRNFQHHREIQLLHQPGFPLWVKTADDHALRCGYLVGFQQLSQKYLVGAFHDRFRVIHHH
ncbi:Uncharacterised protein [Vibrio cholerae]|nr:Uncharacterised protein [Vibrio cholerae]CSB78341.1 Uncharacterised protein [Vibrio cholerae]CSC55862.1 Uncharacterised protein [Vibrio cholerae]CSC90890.1 Uncharacterised protein [Vibrio cholerae]